MNHLLLPQETMSPILQGFVGRSMARSSLAHRQTVFLFLVPLKFVSSLASYVLLFKTFIIPLSE